MTRTGRWLTGWRKHAAPIEISPDRLKRLSTGQLTQLAPQFRVLTLRMYGQLCTRRLADQGTAQLEVMLRQFDEGTS